MAAITVVISIILLLSSATSFIPQYRRIVSRGDPAGISPYYVLFNLIVATEQFAIGLHLIVDKEKFAGSIVLDLAQFSVVWLCHLVLFGIYLFHLPSARFTKGCMVAIYVAFILISVVPVIRESTLPPYGNSHNERYWFSAIYFITHSWFISPCVTVIAAAAMFPQLDAMMSRSEPGAWSATGLAAQAVVFSLVAISWPLRLTPSDSESLVSWYQEVGWAVVDNSIFATAQGILFWVSRQVELKHIATADEATRLIAR